MEFFLEKCNITSIHKKGKKSLMDNYRGVFRVTILRNILDSSTSLHLVYMSIQVTNAARDMKLTGYYALILKCCLYVWN